jgi:uncharacterized SAM-binding protein YcdF (DUF218 family)
MSIRPRSVLEYVLAGFALLLIGDSTVLVIKLRIDVGTLLPALIGLYLLLPLVFPAHQKRYLGIRSVALLWHGTQITGLMLLAGLAGFIWYATSTRQTTPASPPAAIIVLGAGLHGGSPSPMLAARLKSAAALAQQFPAAPIVVSGGQGMLEVVSEARAMQQYLVTLGIPAPRIMQENRARNTAENLTFSRILLARHGIDVTHQTIAIVTSDFHTFRSRRLALRTNYVLPLLIPAETPLSIRPNAWLREYLACIKYRLTGEI